MRVALLLLWLTIATTAMADDNLIAHRLFEQERYAEAAEIYTSPAWKGIALYNSSQWWRAAEAFVRADDYKSMHNLGNTYVKMGYYALALEAYQMSLVKQPDFTDAQINADIMRKLLSLDEEQRGQSAIQRKGEEIDRVESEGDEQSGGDSEDGTDEPDQEQERDDEDREGDTDSRGPTPAATAAGDSGEAGSDKTVEDDGSPDGGSTHGTEAEPQTENNPSTGAEGRDSASDAQAASMRATLESEQATEQWLNQINHNAEKYLRRKIELELQRRKAAGESAPQGGSPW